MSFINIENIHYNGFVNICRTCMVTCNLKPLQDNNIIIEVLHNLTGDLFQINDELPQQICIKCFNKLHEINAFASQCKQSRIHLTESLNNFKNNSIKIEIKEEIIEEPDVKVGILENDPIQIEFAETKTEPNNVFIEQVLIKSENIDEPSSINAPEYDKDPLNDRHEKPSAIENKSADPDSIVHGDDRFKCDICTRSFSHSGNLIRHKKIHTGERPYSCDICDKKITSSTRFNIHMRRHTGERPYQCDQCDKSFTRSSVLIKHKRLHSGERPCQCEICPKAFICSSALIRHMRMHKGERPFKCDVCSKSYLRLYDLKVHQSMHTGEKPYKCNVCNKAFTQSSALKVHQTVHSSDRPFKCDVCSKSFKSARILVKHKRIHAGERPHQCNICNKTYREKDTLNKHKKLHARNKMEVGEQTTSV